MSATSRDLKALAAAQDRIETVLQSLSEGQRDIVAGVNAVRSDLCNISKHFGDHTPESCLDEVHLAVNDPPAALNRPSGRYSDHSGPHIDVALPPMHCRPNGQSDDPIEHASGRLNESTLMQRTSSSSRGHHELFSPSSDGMRSPISREGTWDLDRRQPSKINCTPRSICRNLQENGIDGRARNVFQKSAMMKASNTGTFVAAGLPLSWPAVLDLREGLLEAMEDPTATVQNPHVSRHSETGSWGLEAFSLRLSLAGTSRRGGFVRRYLLWDPDSSRRAVHDVITLLLLTLDLTFIPYMLAWDVPYNTFFRVLMWISLGFWTIDLWVNFFTGYQERGVICMEPVRIALHYLKTWFALDFGVVVCDWIAVVLGALGHADNSSSSLRMIRFAKLSRMLRTIGLLRMMKFVKIAEEFVEKNISDTFRLTIKVISLFIFVFWFNHLMGCVFFAVGRLAPSDTGARWTDVTGIMEWDRMYQYMTAYHWSVSQFTLGAIEVNCYNSYERSFNVLYLILGLVFSSTLVSSLSATMVDFQMTEKENTRKLKTLRRFLAENPIQRRTAILVQQQALMRLNRKKRLTDKEVPALLLISATLRTELRYEMFWPHLATQPLFNLWSCLDNGTVHKLCMEAAEFTFPAQSDEIFTAGSTAEHAYFIVGGAAKYTQEPDSSPVRVSTATQLEEKSWISTAALWCKWIHVGTATAATSCHVLSLHGNTFVSVLQRNYVVRRVGAEYSKHFHHRLISSQPPNVPWPSDLEVPFTEFEDIVLSMEVETQTIIGLHVLDQMAQQQSSPARAWGVGKASMATEKLRAEVSEGMSTIILGQRGEVERVVSVVGLRIRNASACLFVQLAKTEGSQIVPACQLPGGKQERGELAPDAMQRLLAAKLAPLAGCVEVDHWERTVQVKESKEYGVRTKYLRTVCFARLSGNFEAPRCAVRVLPLGSNASAVDHRPSMPTVQATFSITQRKRGSVNSGGSAHTPLPLDPRLLEREVFIIRTNGKAAWYAWLAPEEFELFSSASGEAALAAWISRLDAHGEEGSGENAAGPSSRPVSKAVL